MQARFVWAPRARRRFCGAGRTWADGSIDISPLSAGASIYLAAHNIILAGRALGVGTVLTTNRVESEVRDAPALPDEFSIFALLRIGWPLENFGRLTRRPLGEVAFAELWDEPWPE